MLGDVFGGLGPYTLTFPYLNYLDNMTPDHTADVAFDGDLGPLAVSKETTVFLSTFWSFGLETLPTATDRTDVLSAFVSSCESLPPPDTDACLRTGYNFVVHDLPSM